MTRRSAIVVRQYKRGRIGVPCVQAWVYRDADGRWRNCETGHLETVLSVDIEADVAAAERQWGQT